MEITVNVNLNAAELADAIRTLATALFATGVKVTSAAPETTDDPEPEPERTDPQPEEAGIQVESESTPPITLEQVRAKLAALSQAGKQAQVKKLINDCGASKLTGIPAEKYAELMKAAEAL